MIDVSIQESTNVGFETISPDAVPAVQQNCGGTSMPAGENCASTGQQAKVQAVAGALAMVERLRGVRFEWKTDGRHEIGFIREGVAQVFPKPLL
jgi:Chaperone of endosialidase